MSLRLTAFVEIEKKWLGVGENVASVGLKLEGNMESSLHLSISGELRFVIRSIIGIGIKVSCRPRQLNIHTAINLTKWLGFKCRGKQLLNMYFVTASVFFQLK